MTLDSYGSYSERGDWGGCWGKQRRCASTSLDGDVTEPTYRPTLHYVASGAAP